MKLQIIYIALWSLASCEAVHFISRMSTVQKMRPNPTPFRPGVVLQRPTWNNHQRLVQSASHRTPYVVYRGHPHRYMKPGNQATRSVHNQNNGSWKTTARLPFPPATADYEFVRSATSPITMRLKSNGGAIHTIPAPNLSLSEKPIVVLEASNGKFINSNGAAPEAHKHQTYEVTERFVDPVKLQLGEKVYDATPVGFSKGNTFSAPDLAALLRNGAALQLAPEYGLSAISVPQGHVIHQLQPQQMQPISVQAFQSMQSQPEIQHNFEGIVIPPTALYQSDPTFLQKIQNHLLHRFPSVEFVPYNAPDLQPQVSTQSQVYVMANEPNQQQHSHLSVIPINTPSPTPSHKNVIRETQESTVVSLAPKLEAANITENQIDVETVTEPQNITIEIVAAESQQPTTTVKYVIETTTEEKRANPIYYAQIGQSVGGLEASGIYSAINDVRAAAAALAQFESITPEIKPENLTTTSTTTTTTSTTTNKPEVQTIFLPTIETNSVKYNQTVTEIIPHKGIPFAKPGNVKVAYTLVRSDDKATKVTKDGSVYAGQLVEASISEDQDFNKAKASLLSRRAPIRLVTVSDNQVIRETTTEAKVPVQAKIPPQSKLTFDEQTGEPILRIYASYVNSPLQREAMTTKLNNIKPKEIAPRKPATTIEDWKRGTVKSLDKDHSGSDVNKVTQFGLKLKSRMDDILPIFEDYEP